MINTDRLYIRIPTPEDEQIVMELRKEFLEVEDCIPGAGSLEKIENYSEWLEKVIKDLKPETVPEGRVPSTQYLTFRKSDGRLVGMIQLRNELNDYLLKFGGHIGDCIRPTERNKGYATEQIAIVLKECEKLKINKVLITCKDWNTASAKTIIKNGGVLENEIADENGVMVKRFWITL